MLISQRFCNLFFNGPPLRHSPDTLTIVLPGLKKMLIRVLGRLLHRESFCNYSTIPESLIHDPGKNRAFLLSRSFSFLKALKKHLKFLVKRFEKCIVLVN